MLRPREHSDDWFSLFVIHQNRVRHGQTNYIPEQFLDDFLDLVVWGHEHECLIEPAWNGTQNFYITQPGSTVATSLSDSETKPKHCALLLINKRNFKLRKLPLETVRPFYLEDVVLSESDINSGDPDAVRKVETFCAEKVSSLLDKAERDRVGHQQRPDKPLIRLRVDYSGGFELFSTHRFGQKFVDRVANPKDIVLFHRRKLQQASEQRSDNPDEGSIFESRIEALDSIRVEDMVREYFAKADEAKQLQVLTERGMSDAIKEFVDKEERDAISELASHQIKKTQVYLKKRNATEETVETEVQRYKEERRRNVKQEDSEVREVMSRVHASRPLNESRNDDEDDDSGGEVRAGDFDDGDDDDTRNIPFASPARGRGRGSRRPSRGRGDSNRRGGRGRGRGGRGCGSSSSAEGSSSSRGSKATRSIKDAFSVVPASSKRSATNYSSEEECTIVDDDDDATVSNFAGMKQNSSTAGGAKRSRLDISASNTRSLTGSSRYGRGGGVSYESGDSEEEEFDRSIPQRKRKH